MPTNKDKAALTSKAFGNILKLGNCQPNASGIRPTEFKVIVLPADLGDKFKIAGKVSSLVMPEQVKERDQFAQMEGTLIAVSPIAFTYDDWKTGEPPKVGDRVLFAKYAGTKVTGKNGVEYRLINDKDIAAVLD